MKMRMVVMVVMVVVMMMMMSSQRNQDTLKIWRNCWHDPTTGSWFQVFSNVSHLAIRTRIVGVPYFENGCGLHLSHCPKMGWSTAPSEKHGTTDFQHFPSEPGFPTRRQSHHPPGDSLELPGCFQKKWASSKIWWLVVMCIFGTSNLMAQNLRKNIWPGKKHHS